MPTVFIPTMLLEITGGIKDIQINGSRIKDIIDDLENVFPGIRSRLVSDRKLKEDLAVAIDGQTCRLGLMEPVPDTAKEIHFIAAIAGGL
ncbi:MAG: molybdopterin synthase sulfur carrier subunit [Dehalococcoidia bacterium]|tara:strand:- start:915 stop:1184 length:270 start_codon:yes stop_codon:yes gene_type:complete